MKMLLLVPGLVAVLFAAADKPPTPAGLKEIRWVPGITKEPYVARIVWQEGKPYVVRPNAPGRTPMMISGTRVSWVGSGGKRMWVDLQTRRNSGNWPCTITYVDGTVLQPVQAKPKPPTPAGLKEIRWLHGITKEPYVARVVWQEGKPYVVRPKMPGRTPMMISGTRVSWVMSGGKRMWVDLQTRRNSANWPCTITYVDGTVLQPVQAKPKPAAAADPPSAEPAKQPADAGPDPVQFRKSPRAHLSAVKYQRSRNEIQAEYERALAAAEARRAERVRQVQREFLSHLRAAQTEATKKGDLDTALVIREEVKRLEALLAPKKK